VAQQVLHLLHVLHLSHVRITGHFVGRHISCCGAAGESSLHLRAYLSIYQIQEARARLSIVSISKQVIASHLHGNNFQSFLDQHVLPSWRHCYSADLLECI